MTVNALLQYHIVWLKASQLLADENVNWIYALAAVLEKPVHVDTSASLRGLLRYLSGLRTESMEEPEQVLIPKVKVLSAIAGAYFKQDEKLACLWEEKGL